MKIKEWYSPGEISGAGTVEQLKNFILPHIDELRDGDWPRDPRATGYIDNGWGARNNKAHFINASELAAEVDERMDRIIDSIALILFYTAGWELHRIARNLGYQENDLWYEMERMLKYVAGKKRKLSTYPEWKTMRKMRANVVSGTTKFQKQGGVK